MFGERRVMNALGDRPRRLPPRCRRGPKQSQKRGELAFLEASVSRPLDVRHAHLTRGEAGFFPGSACELDGGRAARRHGAGKQPCAGIALLLRAREEVHLDEMADHLCGTRGEDRGGRGIGAHHGVTELRDHDRERRAVARRLGDLEQDVAARASCSPSSVPSGGFAGLATAASRDSTTRW